MHSITISDALLMGNQKLKKVTNNYINETFWILSQSLNQDKATLLLNQDNILNEAEIKNFMDLINRRSSNEPLQLILNSVSFYNYQFITQKDVFIPRPETELCIDIIKNYNYKFSSTLEIGCGLGCISITLALENISSHIMAIDINEKAISGSILNANKLQCNNVEFIHDNFFKIKHKKKYDLIISNPPYIPISDIKKLDMNVIMHDPLSALTDFDDGLSFYRYLAQQGHQILSKNGLIFVEFGGQNQKLLLRNIFEHHNYKLEFFNDLNHIPRFLAAQLCN